MTRQFETIGRRTVLLSGRQVSHLERILLFIDDITERVESRAAMQASEIRYRRFFEAARDAIPILCPDTRKITDANPFMTELLGCPWEELLDKELNQRREECRRLATKLMESRLDKPRALKRTAPETCPRSRRHKTHRQQIYRQLIGELIARPKISRPKETLCRNIWNQRQNSKE